MPSVKLLYLCTHNACRSILAEAITRRLSKGQIIVASAGSEPAGQIHPLTLQYLCAAGYPTEGLSSKSWAEVKDFEPDVVITVCDQVAGESCPVWFGQAAKGHWGLTDPSRVKGCPADTAVAFDSVIHTLEARINQLLTYPLDSLSKGELVTILKHIGETD